MIRRYNNLSFLFFIPGIIAQVAGVILFNKETREESIELIAAALLISGTIMAIAGYGLYAKAKGRSGFWGVAGFLGLPGVLLLAVLKDRSGDPWNT